MLPSDKKAAPEQRNPPTCGTTQIQSEIAAPVPHIKEEPEEPEEPMTDPVHDLPHPALPLIMRQDLPTESEISRLKSPVKRAKLRALSEAFTALGTAQGLVNMLSTREHPIPLIQKAIHAQLEIAIPVVQEFMRILIVQSIHGPEIARNLEILRFQDRLSNRSQHDAAAVADSIEQTATEEPKGKKRRHRSYG